MLIEPAALFVFHCILSGFSSCELPARIMSVPSLQALLQEHAVPSEELFSQLRQFLQMPV
jgi:hypothetical protein